MELLLCHLEGKYLLWREHHVMMHDELPSGHLRPLHGLGELLESLTVLILHYSGTAWVPSKLYKYIY
jgi:hypothetical protein